MWPAARRQPMRRPSTCAYGLGRVVVALLWLAGPATGHAQVSDQDSVVPAEDVAPLEATASDAALAVIEGGDVALSELTHLVQPLTKDELRVAAEAWQGRLRDKAMDVSQAVIQDEQLAEDEGPEAPARAARLDDITQLRAERVVVMDKLRIVVDALESKTGPEDGETLAAVHDHRLYMSSVAGVHVDTSSAESAWIAIRGWLASEQGGQRWAWNVGVFVGILLVARVVAALVRAILTRTFARLGGSTLLAGFLTRSSYGAVMIAGGLMALSALEVSIGPLLAMVGAAGFIVAFAMQDSLSNLASGLLILGFRPFDTGDVVEAGGVSGTVASMNLVSTTITTFDNKRMIVPNNTIVQGVITNATGVDTRRVDLEFGIGYDDDIDQAQAILEETVAAHALVLADPAPVIRVHTLGDSSVNFIVRPWVKTEDYWTVYWDLTRAVKHRFDTSGIGIPYPQQDVHLHVVDGGEAPRVVGVAPAPREDSPRAMSDLDHGADDDG